MSGLQEWKSKTELGGKLANAILKKEKRADVLNCTLAYYEFSVFHRLKGNIKRITRLLQLSDGIIKWGYSEGFMGVMF